MDDLIRRYSSAKNFRFWRLATRSWLKKKGRASVGGEMSSQYVLALALKSSALVADSRS